MSPLELLYALYEHHKLVFHRVGGRVKVLPRVPDDSRRLLAHYRGALVRALRDGERVEAGSLVVDPFRLVPLVGHALGLASPGVLVLYSTGGRELRQYTVPPGELTPRLVELSHRLPALGRLRLFPIAGGWDVEVQWGWRIGLEVLQEGGYHLALLPPFEATLWAQRLREEIPLPGVVRVWRRGATPVAASSWEEALGHLEAAVRALH